MATPTGATVTDRGTILWDDWDRAQQYARVRHMLYDTRQRVEVVEHEGRPMYHVRKASPFRALQRALQRQRVHIPPPPTSALAQLRQHVERGVVHVPPPEPECNGICVHASELIEGAPDVIAHAHPDCELHGAPSSRVRV